ncbi:unnamed protein product [Protopolystoma xenopodis]|uniref:Uncharacterized protein n=1 Tax=Protopolystoma xenopodis TaxID=117903 RepID=A0A448WFA6_9PLAT|nr:unnamed protein product [Protopolystoma xenopodis]
MKVHAFLLSEVLILAIPIPTSSVLTARNSGSFSTTSSSLLPSSTSGLLCLKHHGPSFYLGSGITTNAIPGPTTCHGTLLKKPTTKPSNASISTQVTDEPISFADLEILSSAPNISIANANLTSSCNSYPALSNLAAKMDPLCLLHDSLNNQLINHPEADFTGFSANSLTAGPSELCKKASSKPSLRRLAWSRKAWFQRLNDDHSYNTTTTALFPVTSPNSSRWSLRPSPANPFETGEFIPVNQTPFSTHFGCRASVGWRRARVWRKNLVSGDIDNLARTDFNDLTRIRSFGLRTRPTFTSPFILGMPQPTWGSTAVDLGRLRGTDTMDPQNICTSRAFSADNPELEFPVADLSPVAGRLCLSDGPSSFLKSTSFAGSILEKTVDERPCPIFSTMPFDEPAQCVSASVRSTYPQPLLQCQQLLYTQPHDSHYCVPDKCRHLNVSHSSLSSHPHSSPIPTHLPSSTSLSSYSSVASAVSGAFEGSCWSTISTTSTGHIFFSPAKFLVSDCKMAPNSRTVFSTMTSPIPSTKTQAVTAGSTSPIASVCFGGLIDSNQISSSSSASCKPNSPSSSVVRINNSHTRLRRRCQATLKVPSSIETSIVVTTKSSPSSDLDSKIPFAHRRWSMLERSNGFDSDQRQNCDIEFAWVAVADGYLNQFVQLIVP